MGRYLLLWLLGIPIPILVLIWLFGGATLTAPPASETGATLDLSQQCWHHDNPPLSSPTNSA